MNIMAILLAALCGGLAWVLWGQYRQGMESRRLGGRRRGERAAQAGSESSTGLTLPFGIGGNKTTAKGNGHASGDTTEDVLDAQAGAVLQLRHIGANMEDLDVTVLARHIYSQGSDAWYELECDAGDRKVWLEITDDDAVELSIGLKKLKLRDVGLTGSELERIERDGDGKLTYDGTVFYFDEADRAIFCRGGDRREAEQVRYWDFESQDGKRFISIERWGHGDGGSIDVTYSEPVRLSQVSVYALAA